jgi:hypothetical protein
MGLRDLFLVEPELRRLPQLDHLSEEERVLRYHRARRDAFMRRPVASIALMFLPLLGVAPALGLASLLATSFPAAGWWLSMAAGVLAVHLCMRLELAIRVRWIAAELARTGPFLG